VQGDEDADSEAGGQQPDHGRQQREQPHVRNTSPFRTATAIAGSGDGAGPPTTAPVVASNMLRWHGHSILPPLTLLT
jgi:hypothetical protein